MNESTSAPTPTSPSRRGFRAWAGIIGTAFALVLIVKAVGAFQLDAEARSLHHAWAETGNQATRLQVQFTAGPGMVAVARNVVRFVHEVPPEAHLALRALNQVSVGVYELEGDASSAGRGAWMGAAEKAMNRDGWRRVAAVSSEDETVMVFVDESSVDASDVRVAIGVSDGGKLVVISGEMELEPLAEIVRRQVERQGLLREA